jgi:catechol 2,3-dioxygenase-like lactoylglutathione lyase family enzyme
MQLRRAILYVKDLDRMKRFYSEMLRATPTSSDRTGVLSLRETYVTDDPRSYAYTAYYQVSSLFVSESGQ